ncbi:MAG: hypothetical protein VZQ49_00045 [Methanobrevibacter sp.]|nr:hypothetical protein [Methanobrevibacter sp.]
MEGITLKITGNLRGPLDEMREQLPRAERRALYRAAYFLRDKIRQSLTSSLPKATNRNPKYSDTLIDAIGFTKVDGASLNINAMGNRKKTSGTYRTRFFENDTRDRYQKSYKGQKLKKKRFLGHITGTHFFRNAVEANQPAAIELMRGVISEFVQEIYNQS